MRLVLLSPTAPLTFQGSVIRPCQHQVSLCDIPCKCTLDPHCRKNLCTLDTVDLSNYNALLPPFSEDPTKIKEKLETLMTIHKPTHRDFDWLLLKNILPTHDYIVVSDMPNSPGERKQIQNFSPTLLQMTKGSTESGYSSTDGNNSRGFPFFLK